MKRNNVPSCIGGEGMKERIHLYEPFFHHYYIDEILNDFENVIKYLSSKNVEVGVAVKPDTDISLLKQYEEYFDKIFNLSVISCANRTSSGKILS